MMKLKIEFLKIFVLEFEFAWLRDLKKTKQEQEVEDIQPEEQHEENI